MLTLTVWAWRHRKAVGGKGSLTSSINELITRMFIEQPLASPGSAKNYLIPSSFITKTKEAEQTDDLSVNCEMYRSSSIMGTKSLLDKSVPYLWQELGPCPRDCRTTIHCNIGLKFFHRPWYIWSFFKIAKTTFQRMVVLQSRRQISSSCWNFMKPGSQSRIEMMKCWKILLKFNYACILCD